MAYGPQCDRLVSLALAAAEWIDGESLEFEEAARLLNQAGFYLDDRAQYTAAEPLYRRALAIREKVLGREHPATVAVREKLASLAKL